MNYWQIWMMSFLILLEFYIMIQGIVWIIYWIWWILLQRKLEVDFAEDMEDIMMEDFAQIWMKFLVRDFQILQDIRSTRTRYLSTEGRAPEPWKNLPDFGKIPDRGMGLCIDAKSDSNLYNAKIIVSGVILSGNRFWKLPNCKNACFTVIHRLEGGWLLMME